MPGYRFIASNTDRSRYYVGELNGRSSKQAYMDALHISESNIINRTFHNPLGKMNGQDICIISLKEVSGNGLCCYRQVNDSDVLVLLEEQDYNEILDETLAAHPPRFQPYFRRFLHQLCFPLPSVLHRNTIWKII